jgi:hypothetical protein
LFARAGGFAGVLRERGASGGPRCEDEQQGRAAR